MAEAIDEERETRQHLRELETTILKAQSPDSEFGREEARLAAVRNAVEEFRTRYGDDRDGLDADSDYREAIEALTAAKREHARSRAAVLAENEDWQNATEELRKLRAGHREEQRAGGGSLDMVSTTRSLRSAQEIAAAARQVIAVGEARLRQMGEKVPPATSVAAGKKTSSAK